MEHWQAHATFTPAGEMLFGVQADSKQEAAEQAQIRVSHIGLPVGHLELTRLDQSGERGR